MAFSKRRKARLLAFDLIYSRQHLGVIEHGEQRLIKASGLQGQNLQFSLELANKGWLKRQEIDAMIAGLLKGWKLQRLAEPLLALLRISFVEMLDWPDTDAKVIINESLEICKSHVDPKACSMLNGLLHRHSQNHGQA